MRVLRRKYGRLRKKANVVVFPGTFEKLVEKGVVSVEQGKFEQAVEAFDQAIIYEPDYPEFLGPYAVALYETKDFERAKEIAAKLLHSGAANYIDAMEMYLTISIQLQEYEEVEMTIGALLDEGVVPDDMLQKFSYLRELNARLSDRYVQEASNVPTKTFTLEEFLSSDTLTQQYALASLEGTDLTDMVHGSERDCGAVRYFTVEYHFCTDALTASWLSGRSDCSEIQSESGCYSS